MTQISVSFATAPSRHCTASGQGCPAEPEAHRGFVESLLALEGEAHGEATPHPADSNAEGEAEETDRSTSRDGVIKATDAVSDAEDNAADDLAPLDGDFGDAELAFEPSRADSHDTAPQGRDGDPSAGVGVSPSDSSPVDESDGMVVPSNSAVPAGPNVNLDRRILPPGSDVELMPSRPVERGVTIADGRKSPRDMSHAVSSYPSSPAPGTDAATQPELVDPPRSAAKMSSPTIGPEVAPSGSAAQGPIGSPAMPFLPIGTLPDGPRPNAQVAGRPSRSVPPEAGNEIAPTGAGPRDLMPARDAVVRTAFPMTLAQTAFQVQGRPLSVDPEVLPGDLREGALEVSTLSGEVRMARAIYAPPGMAQPVNAPVPQIQPIAQAVRVSSDGDVLEVTLRPEELGRVQISVSRTDGGLGVVIQVHRDETMVLLRRHADLLEAALNDLGMGDVDIAFSDARDEPPARDRDIPLMQSAAEPAEQPKPRALLMTSQLDLRL